MRILLGSLSGGFILFLWVFIFKALPIRERFAFLPPVNDALVHEVLQENLQRPGVYHSLRDWPDDPQLQDAYLHGPTFIIHYPGGGHQAGMIESLLGLLVVLLAPLVPAVMLTVADRRVKARFWTRALFISGFGVFLGIFVAPFSHFFGGQPLANTAFLAARDIIGWFLVGVVVAPILYPKEPKPDPLH